MRTYFLLLSILFLSSAFLRMWNMVHGLSGPLLISHLSDLILFGLCLRVCFGMAWNRRYFEPPQVRLIYWGTMLLGLVSTVLRGLGPRVGLPFAPASLPDLLLWFLVYALFAAPAVLLDYSLRREERQSGSGPHSHG
jgi:cytochrome c oxidase assembly factor CtaG